MITISARLAKVAPHLPVGHTTTAANLSVRCGIPGHEAAAVLRQGVKKGFLTSHTGPGPAFVTRFTVVHPIVDTPRHYGSFVVMGLATRFVGGVNPWTGEAAPL